MRKLLLSALLFCSFTIVKAQITLEHTYSDNRIDYNFLSNGDVIYSSLNTSSGLLKIYSENHSLLKELTVPAVAEYSFLRHLLVSDKLFDVDAGLEYCMLYYNQSNGKGLFRILDESGTVLLETESGDESPELIKTSTGMKLFLSGSIGNGIRNGMVYSLPGSIPLSAKGEANTSNVASPFPNPAGNQINIPYNLNGNDKASIHIYDSTGKEVEYFTVDATFGNLLLNTSTYHNGTYFYKIVTADSPVVSKRFIVIR